jgi:hypothetical protein
VEPSAPPVPVRSPRAARPRWRLAALGLALAALGAAAWGLHAHRVAESAPEALFDHVRERVEAGDGAALWRVMLPRAREDYVKFLRDAATRTDTRTEDWRRRAGLTREDLQTLPPETIMARENLAYAPEFWTGARVYRVDRWDEHTALLRISTRSGDDRLWLVKRVDGAWWMDDFQPMVLPDGSVRPRPGEDPRKGTVPVDGVPTGPPLVRPSGKR